ncbi:integrase core domain-containing protein, partial [Kocuria rosea]|uniref:integrase core domain-containing protein n=1 Tax=Kocuria rosea TaxID=1275 RepID=UPI00232ABA13
STTSSATNTEPPTRSNSPLDEQKGVHGVQFTSWVFTQKIRSAGLLPSFGAVGDGLDNAMMESFWSTMQIELLNCQKWKTRIELANAIFEYIEVFYNRRRRHSALQYATPHEYDLARTPQALTTAGS